MIRGGELALLGSSALVAPFLFRFFQLGRRQARLPPEGWWSLGAWRALVGPPARRAGLIGMGLCVALTGATLALVVAIELLLGSLLRGGGSG